VYYYGSVIVMECYVTGVYCFYIVDSFYESGIRRKIRKSASSERDVKHIISLRGGHVSVCLKNCNNGDKTGLLCSCLSVAVFLCVLSPLSMFLCRVV
jgi:hypothetical protein